MQIVLDHIKGCATITTSTVTVTAASKLILKGDATVNVTYGSTPMGTLGPSNQTMDLNLLGDYTLSVNDSCVSNTQVCLQELAPIPVEITNPPDDYEIITSDWLCVNGTWQRTITPYINGVAQADQTLDSGQPCDQPMPAEPEVDTQVIEVCDPATNTLHDKVIRYTTTYDNNNNPTTVETVVSYVDKKIECGDLYKDHEPILACYTEASGDKRNVLVHYEYTNNSSSSNGFDVSSSITEQDGVTPITGASVTGGSPNTILGACELPKCELKTFYKINFPSRGTVEKQWIASAGTLSNNNDTSYKEVFSDTDAYGYPAYPVPEDSIVSANSSGSINVGGRADAQTDFYIYLKEERELFESHPTADTVGVFMGECGSNNLVEKLEALYSNTGTNPLGFYKGFVKVRGYIADFSASGRVVIKYKDDIGALRVLDAYPTLPEVEEVQGWVCDDGKILSQDKSFELDPNEYLCVDPRCAECCESDSSGGESTLAGCDLVSEVYRIDGTVTGVSTAIQKNGSGNVGSELIVAGGFRAISTAILPETQTHDGSGNNRVEIDGRAYHMGGQAGGYATYLPDFSSSQCGEAYRDPMNFEAFGESFVEIIVTREV